MSFNKFATIFAATAISLSFAGVAQATGDGASGDFDGEVESVCTVTSPNAPTLTQQSARLLSGTGKYEINCNSATAGVTVAPDTGHPDYQIRNGEHTAEFMTGSTGAFADLTSGTAGTSDGEPTSNDAVKVKVKVQTAAPAILLGGAYKAVTKVTVAAN
jgi:hypothetical protein